MIDFVLKNGQVIIGESTRDHQQDILLTAVGSNKFKPTHGVGVAGYIDDETTDNALLSKIKQEFERDGMEVGNVSISAGKINIDAKYSNS